MTDTENGDVSPIVLDRYRAALRTPLLEVPESTPLLYGRAWVLDRLPHRPPFVFLDGVQAIQRGILCARYAMDQSADLFRAHFPGVPRWPGVIQIEAMAQAGLTLYFDSRGACRAEVALAVVREARFIHPVLPGVPVQLLGSFVEDGLFIALVGQTLQGGRVCSACLLSVL